jgi:acetyl/propionyl-CoA carboxylase alpha subunit
VVSGSWVSPEFDPLLSKLSVWGRTRTEALARLRRALAEYSVLGVATNLGFLERLLAHPSVVEGRYDTTFVERTAPELHEVTSPEQQLRDALLLTALAAEAERGSALPAPTTTASSSGWRDYSSPRVTRYR